MKKILLPCLALSLMVACKNGENNQNANNGKDVVASNVDTTVSPNTDFFQFANGGWLKANPIPASEAAWGIGNKVQEDVYLKVRKISEDAAKEKAKDGTNSQKIGDFYAEGMDTAKIEKMGYEPLKADLGRIQAAKSTAEIVYLIGDFQAMGVDKALFSAYVWQDAKKSDQNALQLWQGGLGLPERDYYLNSDARNKNIRTEYEKYINTVFQLLGNDAQKSAAQAKAIVKMETDLAKSHRKLEDLRDPYKNYNKMDLAGLSKLTPSVDWKGFFAKSTAVKIDSVIVGQPEFYQQVEKSLKTVSLEDWKSYLTFHLVREFSDRLSKNFDDANFNFYGKVMNGKKQQKDRWKRVLDAQENVLGDALGQLFVKEFFDEKAKKRYTEMTDNVFAAFADHIKALDWMSQTTKDKALLKLSKVTKKIGYPEKFKDFSAMKIDRSSYVQNTQSANRWWTNYMFSKLGKPVDRSEWDMTPQTYNAYYNPSNNEIVLPAAIFLIPGFKDSEIDDAVVYGYGGASTIGHEITHGFDDEGRQFDEVGNLKSWWTKEDEDKFKVKAQALVQQFNGFTVLDTNHVRGQATLGENIADLGGVVLAYDAFKKTAQYKENKPIAGYTPSQRYYMGYALGWMTQYTSERQAMQIMTDVHAPAKWRVNGPFMNVPEFYAAFNLKKGDKMFREEKDRVKIW